MRTALVLAALPFIVAAILARPFFGVVLFIATDFVRPQDLTWGFEEVRFQLVLSVATLAGYAIQRRRFDSPPRGRAEIWMSAFLVVLALSSGLAQVSVSVALDWFVRLAKIVVFCFLLSRMVDSRERLERALQSIVFGVGALGAWAFLQHFQGNERLEGIGNGGDQNNSNHLGAIFCLTLPIAVAVASNAPKRSWTRLGALGLVPVLLADIVFTQSRAAYLALLGLAAFAVLKRRIRRKVLAWGFVCALLAGGVGFQQYVARAETIVSDGSRGAKAQDGSIALRVRLWGYALDFFTRNPLTGVGPQNSGMLIKDETYIGKAKSIHNTYLQLLADTGLLGLGCWVAILLAGWRDARHAERLARAAKDDELWRVALAFELGIAAFAAASMFHSFEYLEEPYWVVALAGCVRGFLLRERVRAPVLEERLVG